MIAIFKAVTNERLDAISQLAKGERERETEREKQERLYFKTAITRLPVPFVGRDFLYKHSAIRTDGEFFICVNYTKVFDSEDQREGGQGWWREKGERIL